MTGPFIFLTMIQAIYATNEFTIQGNGSYEAGKLKVDLHLESTMNITSETTVPPTSIMTTLPPTTNATTIPPTSSSRTSPAASETIPPSTLPPTPGPTVNSTTLGPETGASSRPTNITSTPTTLPPTAAKGDNITSTTGQPTISAAVNVTTPTPAPEYNDGKPLANSKQSLDRTALELHNYYRSIHEAPLLTLDENLRKDAQDYALKVARSQMLRPEQDFVLNSKNEGENLGFRCSTIRPDPEKALRQIMKRWYDEGCQYNFQAPPTDKYSFRHFTQMTWNGSRRLGVGITYGKINNLHCLYFVARYRPRGNLGNKLIYINNVKKGVFDSSFCRPIVNQVPNQEVILKE
ncbi:probable pathogenesis-related protein ARB_02861 isoform X2 [Stylophora pistillata]|uniref:probable pathogenesis-related protein ARB_02861 isoform X2 n=1 Tax=Stylophora pistillata TaxID=50429 RepID=UPI000C04E827|nr:probable pathogenesis-related protein ARB_02861 isoform X2 [Stylophora pistillata]